MEGMRVCQDNSISVRASWLIAGGAAPQNLLIQFVKDNATSNGYYASSVRASWLIAGGAAPQNLLIDITGHTHNAQNWIQELTWRFV